MEIERTLPSRAPRFPWKWLLIGLGILVAIGVIVFLVYTFGSKSTKPPTPSPAKTQNPRSKLALSYLTAVYPLVKNETWKSLSDDKVIELYQSLCWYYTPLPLDVGQQSVILPETKDGAPNKNQIKTLISRRAPLVGAYYNIATEAFLTDGQDQVQILSGVHEGGPPNFNPDLSCTGSQVGFAGVMPNNQFYMPVLEDSVTKELGAGVGVTDWWPAYVDPNPNNPDAKSGATDGVCGFSDICLSAGSAGAKPIVNSDGKKQAANYCFAGAAGAFASAFPASPMGPIWNMGMKPCDPQDLDFDGTNPTNTTKQPAISGKCMANLYGLDETNNSILGASSSRMLSKARASNRTSDKFQMVNIIQPYARKQGCPNFGFMEGVAYVMEGLGRKLLNAPNCSTDMGPSSVAALGRNAWCVPSKTGKSSSTFDRNTGSLTAAQMVKCDPSDYTSCQKSAQDWKNAGSVEYYTANPYDPRNCSNCCFSSSVNTIGAANETAPGTTSQALDQDYRAAYNLAKDGDACIQSPGIGRNCTGGKIMFYWMNGYGKFLNMGLTGIYSNYIGFLMSCPNLPWSATDATKGPFLRRTLPQIKAIGLGGGAAAQLIAFTSGKNFKDDREYLSGYATLFQQGAPIPRSKSGYSTKLFPGNFSTVLNKTVPYKYDFEAAPEDYENCVIIVTGRMLFAKKWGPHVLPSKSNASVWKSGKIDLSTLQKAQTNTWYSEKFKDMNLPANMQTPPGIGNCQGLLNPQEGIANFVNSAGADAGSNGDNFLCKIAAYTVQCYYPPNLRIKNPGYKSYSNLTPEFGAILWGAQYLMGDTGADWYGYNKGPATCAQVSDPKQCPTWPFGTYYFGANIGSCVYGITAALGWNSSQFTIMSTGGGGSKACDYPNYDYEIVYVGGSNLKNQVCQNTVTTKDSEGNTRYNDDVYGFKLLDISGGNQASLIDYYTQQNYVQGSSEGMTESNNDLITCMDTGSGPVWAGDARVAAFKSMFSQFSKRYETDYDIYKQIGFDTCIMPLSEMNVHTDTWGDNRPNALFYKEPSGKCDVVSGKTPEDRAASLQKYLECENKGGTAKTWPFGIQNSGASDCPYKDGKFGMRQQALNNDVDQLWAHTVNRVAQVESDDDPYMIEAPGSESFPLGSIDLDAPISLKPSEDISPSEMVDRRRWERQEGSLNLPMVPPHVRRPEYIPYRHRSSHHHHYRHRRR